MIRVLIADDETLMRAGIRLILENDPDITVAAEASDGRQAVELTRQHRIDVALLDIRMPGGDGLKAAEQIARTASVVMLTTFGEDSYVAQALKVGATGFLLKDTPPQELINAVRKAAAGEPILAPQITRRLIEKHLTEPDRGSAARARIDTLTETERNVLRLVGEGLSNAEIGEQLYMATGTVKAHISRILPKLECANRVQAAIVAHDAGLTRS
ncbi:response regulator [Lentzea jiangxiensis]|uniref:DNA-binding response regulator, NarL/FixJ family, contains REC and HTH domains n=1 Tax=Lentzea jiangxiensis TaxID=641025 RepID=A0A1H0H8D5_9PSEU|nr:response regulator transcription factor [Lentzea jiangxiensis]SDO15476.1 DNA-binding response regulator, NarL/FixJ family, contains REC and HTH domains [Lentzea jiangxiensis]